MRYYLYQIRYQFSTQPLLMGITVLGTALSITFIMLYIMMQQIYIVPFAPEINRGRTLMLKSVVLSNGSSSWLADDLIYGLVQPMQSVETYGIYSDYMTQQASLPGKTAEEVGVRATDAGFWKIFEFTFLQGSPYTAEEVQSGILSAVIDEDLARKMWEHTDVVGELFELDYLQFKVSGVVRPVSTLATFSHANVWAPFTALGLNGMNEYGLLGPLHVALLARDKSDFPKIRQEFTDLTNRFNEEIKSKGIEVDFLNQPDEQATAVKRKWSNIGPDMETEKKAAILILGLLLFIPAITLSAMLHSRLRLRRMEIGVRRSFGASRRVVLQELFMESLLVTLLGGVLGLLLCILLSVACGSWLFPYGAGVELYPLINVLFHWKIFGAVLMACVVLNLIASIFPLWRVIKMNITDTMK